MRIEPVFVIQGQEGPAHPFSSALEAEIIETITPGVQGEYQRLIQQKIAALECPVHHQHAQVQVVAVTYSATAEAFDGDCEVEACCPEFQATVLDALILH